MGRAGITLESTTKKKSLNASSHGQLFWPFRTHKHEMWAQAFKELLRDL